MTWAIQITVFMENIQSTKSETISDWYAQTTSLYWTYHNCVAFLFWVYSIQNFIFVESVALDVTRRLKVTQLLSEALEVDINRKTGVGVRMLSINFMHPPSLLTWLEMRQMVFDVGKRFYIRIQGDIVCFMIVIAGQIVFPALVAHGYIYNTAPLFKFWHFGGILI